VNGRWSPHDRGVLARYSGWGALPNIFDTRRPEHAEHRHRLKELLLSQDYDRLHNLTVVGFNAGEYAEANASVLNAHYTSPDIAAAMWDALKGLGFAGGAIQQIPANFLLVKTVSVVGLNFGSYVGWSPNDIRYEAEDRLRAGMAQLFAWFEEGRLRPHVEQTFPLDGFRDAMAAVLGRRAIGRVAVVMEEGLHA